MIGRVLKRGKSVRRLLYYLYGPGHKHEHLAPHLVGGWRHPETLEPPVRESGGRDFSRLAALLEMPLALLGDQVPEQPVLHITVRAAPGDPQLGDGAWMDISAELMHRTGLSERGHEEEGVRWVAVHHGDNHIHIAAVLVRQDGRRAHLHNEYYRIGETVAWAEREYGLRIVARADRTAGSRPSRAETEKSRRAGRSEPPRITLRRQVAAAAAASRSEAEFFAGLKARGLTIRLRYSNTTSHEITGYAVSLPGDLTAAGAPVWYGGGKLAADLTLPKLRRRWRGGTPRLTGRAMGGSAARVALQREVSKCAAVARSEAEFFANLKAAGLQVRLRTYPTQPGGPTAYAVSLPGLVHPRDGQPMWFGDGTLDDRLTLPALRTRWRAGRTGAPPGPQVFQGADTSQIYAYAASVANQAALELRSHKPRPDVAWAAADLIAAAAEATGNAELGRAADAFARAARTPWGRVPRPTPTGAMLRTASYLLAACRPGGYQGRTARLAVLTALTGLARTLAGLRRQQDRFQASALLAASADLAADALAKAAATQVPGEATAPTTQLALRARPARVAQSRPPRVARRRGPGR